MTLLWCMLAIIVAMLVSRYNQSNKLFWILLVSFLSGIAGAAVFNKMASKESSNKEKLTQVCPTQGVLSISDYDSLLAGTDIIPAKCQEPALVSQDYIPASSEQFFIVAEWTIPTHTPPPQKKLPCILTSTRHDNMT